MKFSGYGYEMEELREKFEGEGIKVDAELKIQNRKISGLATPEDIADAVTLGYANNNYMNKSTDNIISGDNTFSGENTFTGYTIFSNTITGDISGNAETVTNGVYTTGDQTIGGNKTFSNTITGDISGNAETVTNGVYTTGDQTIGGTKTFSNIISGDISGNSGTVTNGVYTIGDQTIGGTKTFSNTITGDISGNAGTVTNGVYTTGNQTIFGIKTFSDSIAVDTVSEGAGADGVTVDGVKLKDGGGTFTDDINADTIGTETSTDFNIKTNGTNRVSVSSAGVVSMPNQSNIELFKTSSQAVTVDVDDITFQTENIDKAGEVDLTTSNTTINFKSDGLYEVTLSSTSTFTGTAKLRKTSTGGLIGIYQDGSVNDRQTRLCNIASGAWTLRWSSTTTVPAFRLTIKKIG